MCKIAQILEAEITLKLRSLLSDPFLSKPHLADKELSSIDLFPGADRTLVVPGVPDARSRSVRPQHTA